MSTTKLAIQTQSALALIITEEAPAKHQTTTFNQQTPALLHPSKEELNNQNVQRRPLRFCPVCKTLLRTVESRPMSLRCKACGYRANVEQTLVLQTKPIQQRPSEIAVIDKEKASLYTQTVVQATCERCGKNESETWTVSVGSEGAVSAWVFLKCTSCGFTRREVG
jgi:DNA-directed RNA polymerase subunit M/transcription elongation factor TFIIS